MDSTLKLDNWLFLEELFLLILLPRAIVLLISFNFFIWLKVDFEFIMFYVRRLDKLDESNIAEKDSETLFWSFGFYLSLLYI